MSGLKIISMVNNLRAITSSRKIWLILHFDDDVVLGLDIDFSSFMVKR